LQSSPSPITSVSCAGNKITVGCKSGACSCFECCTPRGSRAELGPELGSGVASNSLHQYSLLGDFKQPAINTTLHTYIYIHPAHAYCTSIVFTIIQLKLHVTVLGPPPLIRQTQQTNTRAARSKPTHSTGISLEPHPRAQATTTGIVSTTKRGATERYAHSCLHISRLRQREPNFVF